MTQVEKSIASGPKIVSRTLQGIIRKATSAIPQDVNAIRSGTPRTRSSGTRLTTVSETPRRIGVALDEEAPETTRSAASVRPASATTRRRRRLGSLGSGRFRMAVEIVITLTRHAEMATTTRVMSTPSA